MPVNLANSKHIFKQPYCDDVMCANHNVLIRYMYHICTQCVIAVTFLGVWSDNLDKAQSHAQR